MSQFTLGVIYLEGTITPKNVQKGVMWLRKSAELGYMQAQCHLGDCYAKGTGVGKNTTEAVKWYKKAAEQGSTYARDALKKLGL